MGRSCSCNEPDGLARLPDDFIGAHQPGPAGVGEGAAGLILSAPCAQLDEVGMACPLILWTTEARPEPRDVTAPASAVLYGRPNRPAELARLLWGQPSHHAVRVTECLTDGPTHESGLCRWLHGVQHALESFELSGVDDGGGAEPSGENIRLSK